MTAIKSLILFDLLKHTDLCTALHLKACKSHAWQNVRFVSEREELSLKAQPQGKKNGKIFENIFLTLESKAKIKAQQHGERSCYIQFHTYLKYKSHATHDQEGLRACMCAILSGGMYK